MSTFLAGIVIGLIIGANVGLFVLALTLSAIDRDHPRGSEREQTNEQEPHGEVVIVHRR